VQSELDGSDFYAIKLLLKTATNFAILTQASDNTLSLMMRLEQA
jgi:hypothetical protein